MSWWRSPPNTTFTSCRRLREREDNFVGWAKARLRRAHRDARIVLDGRHASLCLPYGCELRAHRRQPWPGRRESCLGGIAAHDGFALGVAQHRLDIGKTIGRQLLDSVDHLLRATAPVRAHDF